MPATNPICLARKNNETACVIAQEPIDWCLAVDTEGNRVTTAGAYVYGFAQTTVDTGQRLTIEIEGECIAIAGSPLTKGDELSVGTGGRLNVAAAGDHVVGRALEDVPAGGLYTIIRKTEEGYKA